jgi:hypothetical protein
MLRKLVVPLIVCCLFTVSSGYGVSPQASETARGQPQQLPTSKVDVFLPQVLNPYATLTATTTSVPVPSATASVTPSFTPSVTPSLTPPATPTLSPTPSEVFETFEASSDTWRVLRITTGNGTIERSAAQAANGAYAARVSTTAGNSSAQIAVQFRDAAVEHQWKERPGTWHWQWAKVYIPSSTVAQLGPNDYFTLAGMRPNSGGSFGWFLRVRSQGQLAVYGYDADGLAHEVRAYGNIPLDRWFDLELGLHSQAGPGVKRAFAFVIDGDVYGWYRQGHMRDETYDRVAFGILGSSVNKPLEVFIDQWYTMGTDRFPTGPDHRSVAAVQEHDFRNQSGINVQYDWSTWKNAPTLHATAGLYTPIDRIQAGHNIDRMPSLESGWAEIEIDWVNGSPTGGTLFGAFAGLIGFRKEINREENLEVAPVLENDGKVRLVYNAWTGGDFEIFSRWQLPAATTVSNSNIPEPGDRLRVRWEQLDTKRLHVQVSYYDASTNTWHTNVIDDTRDLSQIAHAEPGTPPINYLDNYHLASSITIDSPLYAIRRFRVGTLDSYP